MHGAKIKMCFHIVTSPTSICVNRDFTHIKISRIDFAIFFQFLKNHAACPSHPLLTNSPPHSINLKVAIIKWNQHPRHSMIDERRAPPSLCEIKRPISLRRYLLPCRYSSRSYSERLAERNKGVLTDIRSISFRPDATAKRLTISTSQRRKP
jgi:hypothetical protein